MNLFVVFSPSTKFWIMLILILHFQEIHAPILSIWGVKIVVISIFVAFTLASIVSYAEFVSIFFSVEVSFSPSCPFFSLTSDFFEHRHYAPGLNLVWNRRLFFPKILTFRSNSNGNSLNRTLMLSKIFSVMMLLSFLFFSFCRGISIMFQNISELDPHYTLLWRTIIIGIELILILALYSCLMLSIGSSYFSFRTSHMLKT